MVEYGVEPADLPAEKEAQMREAVADLEHYRQKLARLFADDLKNELDAVKLPDGKVVQLPEPASQQA
jgi:DNA repair ATPase RecN